MIRRRTVLAGVILFQMMGSVHVQAINRHYPVNREPLAPRKFVPLPLGAVKPQGWLRDQLTVMSNGLTGHLDEFWGSLVDSAWKGGGGESWERGPYYLDGLVPLAYLLDDERLLAKVHGWIEPILASGQPDGWFGPRQNHDRWPLAVAMKVLTQYHEATGDERVITLLQNYFRYLATHPPDWPDGDWRGVRAMENLVTAYWLYDRTGDATTLVAAESIYLNSFDWTMYFLDFPFRTEGRREGVKYGHPSHVVNIAMAIKDPGVWFQQSHNLQHKKAVYEGLKSLDRHHGQVAGRFSGDEHLSGRAPTQGTELCGVVEFMFSLETLVAVMGDPALADRLEMLAYNANPGACTADGWAHQYDQQANQVWCSVAKRNWSTNSDSSNVYGLEPHYGCCTANMHQGWPKFVSHKWMATHDQGLAAVAYGPSQVTARVADGTEVTITESTDYPFDGAVTMRVDAPAATRFPLHLRIPGWARGARVRAGGEQVDATAGTFLVLDRTWTPGETVHITFPMDLRTEQRFNKAVAVLRGPLYYALRIGEKRIQLKRHHDKLPVIDWEIQASTPWNYGLLIDRGDPGKSITVNKRAISSVPFSTEDAPVVLTVKGKAIPEWTLVDNSAGDPPTSPVVSNEPVTQLELVPYGCTRLRITEFPLIKP